MHPIIIATIISYFIGSIPTAYIFGRLLKGIDIRTCGSGNIGATNALRVLGKWPGIAVLALDIFKGFIAVVALGNYITLKANWISQELVSIILGISCIAGHNWTVFLKFKGGKGIATSLGVLIALAVGMPGIRMVLLCVVIGWLVVFIISRIVSLASILAAILLPILMLIFKQSATLIFSSIILSAFIILRHKSNLSRILQGKETRLKF